MEYSVHIAAQVKWMSASRDDDNTAKIIRS